MKTNEEKLKQLLQIAVENGWKRTVNIGNNFKIDEKYAEMDNGLEYENYKLYSLNDLITNFEPNEVSFIEALCKASTKDSTSFLFSDKNTHKLEDFYLDEKLRVIWTLQPTSQRLDWLFETFKHLLDEKTF